MQWPMAVASGGGHRTPAGSIEVHRLEGSKLGCYAEVVDDSRDGPSTINAAIADAVLAAVLRALSSRDQENFADKLVSAMRNRFGGHIEPKVDR